MNAQIATPAVATTSNLTQTLGTIGMIASPMMLISSALSGFEQQVTQSDLNAVLGLIFVLGWLCSAVGLRRLRATGSGVGSAIVFGIQLVGLLLATSQQVMDLVHAPDDTLFYGIADASWPLSVLFMLVVGTLAIRARMLPDRLRFAPLLCGFALPVMILLFVAVGTTAGIVFFGFYTAAAWMLLGYVVRTGAQVAAE